jgi:uncharacterized protein (TIGR03086 family)
VDLLAQLEEGLEYAGKRVAGVPAGALDAPTPCAEWTVRQLLNHLVGSVDILNRLAAGDDVDRARIDAHLLANTDAIGTNPAAAFGRAADAALAVWRAPGVFERLIDFPAQDTPAAVVANIMLIEVLGHGWDLGAATGQPEPMDPAVARSGLAWTQPFLAQVGRGTSFAPAVTVLGGASPTDELVAFLGRDPRRALAVQ